MRFLPVALALFHTAVVAAQDDPACVANCAAQTRADFNKFSCANADDAPCLCAKSDFTFGVRDCATACGASEDSVSTFLDQAFCAGLSQASSDPGVASTTAPQPSSEPTTAPPPATTSQAPQSTSAPESTAPKTTESTAAQTSPSSSPSSSSASSTSISPSSTSHAAAGSTPAPGQDGDKDGEDGGLSKAAVIGIAVGVSAAGIAALAILICLILKRRGRKQPQFIEISKPIPHPEGDSSYGTTRRDPFVEKRSRSRTEDIEMTTNRYEDMLPAQEPRTIV